MALTKPNKGSTTEKAPRVWMPKSGVSIWEGAAVGRYPVGSNAGYIDNIGADPDLVCVGVSRHNCGAIPAGHVATFALETIVDEIIIPMTFAATLTTASRNALVYGIDENNGSLSPVGPAIGMLWEVDSTTVGRVGVGPKYVAMAQSLVSGSSAASNRAVCRAMISSLAASNTGTTTGTLTGPANTALGTQDGVTLVVGDDVFIQEGTANLAAASDAGPYRVLALGSGSSKWILERPPWYLTGSVIPLGFTVEIGPEGTGIFSGSTWRTFATKGKLVDTDAPVFWPRFLTRKVTLASGTLASAKTDMPVKSTSSGIKVVSLPTTAPHASTRVWRASAVTAGVTGSASIQVVAESAPGTTNASDVGDYAIELTNF